MKRMRQQAFWYSGFLVSRNVSRFGYLDRLCTALNSQKSFPQEPVNLFVLSVGNRSEKFVLSVGDCGKKFVLSVGKVRAFSRENRL